MLLVAVIFLLQPFLEAETSCVHLSSKVTVSIRYSDLLLTLPSKARVLAWPLRSTRRTSTRASTASAAQPIPFHLPYAEDALKTLCLPEGSYLSLSQTIKLYSEYILSTSCVSAYADIVLELPHALKRIFFSQESD
jgi:centromere protein O